MLNKKYFIWILILLPFWCNALDIGNEAPEIILQNTQGKEMSLSSLKGKVVLVDFWASWCHPCREANPILVETYLKYHHKGFEIVSVSLDEDKKHWVDAISKDKLPWKNHVSDLKGWESKTVKDYHVEALPTSFLLDRNGKIVALDPYAEDLELELEDIFLKEISFYPKNVSNKLYLSLPVKYEVRNSKGKKIMKGEGDVVDASSLEEGVYSIKFAGKIEKFLKKNNQFKAIEITSKTNKEIIFSKIAAYEIHSSDGEIIKNGEASSVNISSFEEGEYFLHISGNVEKFIKK